MVSVLAPSPGRSRAEDWSSVELIKPELSVRLTDNFTACEKHLAFEKCRDSF